ncbi:MAG: sorbosone dehydrogenase family protein [Gammaproteobacteria bacterium]
MKKHFFLSSLFFFVFLFYAKVTLAKPVNWPAEGLPEPYATPSANRGARIIDQPDSAELKVPEGFQVEEYMSGFVSPRFMILGSKDEIILSDTFVGKVYVIKDKKRKLLIRDLNNPYGLAFYKNWLYIAETTAVRRYEYDPDSLAVTSEGEMVVDMSEFNRGHITRSIIFDHKADKFYLSVGSRSNVDPGEPTMRAAISRFNPDGSGKEIFASGIRNGVGLRKSSVHDQIWVTSHERDGLGDDLVPDYLTSVNKDDFLGWPYAYIGPHEDPRNAGLAPELVAKTRYPDVLLGSHVGALDFIFYNGDQFPDKYRGGCFVALHGSWNRSKLVGYRLVFVPFTTGKPIAGPEDFLTGWLLPEDSNKVWGRPVGLMELKDGSILVTDDAAGKIWRISYSE